MYTLRATTAVISIFSVAIVVVVLLFVTVVTITIPPWLILVLWLVVSSVAVVAGRLMRHTELVVPFAWMTPQLMGRVMQAAAMEVAGYSYWSAAVGWYSCLARIVGWPSQLLSIPWCSLSVDL